MRPARRSPTHALTSSIATPGRPGRSRRRRRPSTARPALPSGVYRISVEAAAFKRLEREASVEAGPTTTVDLTLELGEMTESVTVVGTQPLIRHDHHQVGGLVTRDQIERLPLNGRNFLELAKLEPGRDQPGAAGRRSRVRFGRSAAACRRFRASDRPA